MAVTDDTEKMRRVRSALDTASLAVPFVACRFALILAADQSPREVADQLRTALTALSPIVAPISDLDPRVLLLTLSGRTFGADQAAIYDAAYRLVDVFDLEAAEPDLPGDFFPEPAEPSRESIENFPPGCWAPEESSLEDKPRWALLDCRVPQAWDYSTAQGRPTRGLGIVVAQPDTGVTAHAELVGVRRSGGADILDQDDDPTDPLDYWGNTGHGTGTASVLLSREDGVVCGAAPAAIHMPIRAVESVVRVSQVNVARAIHHAVDNGAHVITMSLGGVPSFALHRALRRAVAADVIVLAAAGNCVRWVVWPARYDDCIAVAGVNYTGAPWRGTCYGSAVDISAPAENVYRAVASKGLVASTKVGQGQGTSFAVALTAGIAALWLAHHGRADLIASARARGETLQAMFRRLLRATARRPDRWDVFSMGAGIADAEALLKAPLDLGRDLETAALPSRELALESWSVQSLAMEATEDPAVAASPDFDWHLYGPELARALLTATKRKPVPGGIETESVSVTDLSSSLSGRLLNPTLRKHLGLGPQDS